MSLLNARHWRFRCNQSLIPILTAGKQALPILSGHKQLEGLTLSNLTAHPPQTRKPPLAVCDIWLTLAALQVDR